MRREDRTRADRTAAGRSATSRYHEARRLRRRRQLASVVVLAVSAGFLAAAASNGLRLSASSACLLALGAAGGVLAWRRWPRDDPVRWLRGAAGERATAALLAGLSRRRWTVLHDRAIPASRANVDHLVIGPTGVWVVDSKACRAPLRIRRGDVWAGSEPVVTHPAAWEAHRVSQLLDADVTPLVVVHGEGLRRRGKRSGGVRVVPASGLLRRLRHGRRVLRRMDAAALAVRAEGSLPHYSQGA